MKMLLVIVINTIYTIIPSNDQPDHPYFIAMEYKGLSNCMLKVYVTDSVIVAVKVNGYIACAPNFGIGTTVPMKHIHDPEAYVNKKKDIALDSLMKDELAFLRRDRDNFIIRRSEITKIWHDPTHKWGMGYYPDQGKIYVESVKTAENREPVREFIIVGDQNPNRILSMLSKEKIY